MSLRAVVFDVDGVLVQSMERHYEAYRRVFETLGVVIAPHEVYENEGRRSREVIASLAEARGIRLAPSDLERLNAEKQRTFLAFGPQPLYPGARELVDALRGRGLRTAAVTGTNRQNVENHFGGFVASFDHIVTADDVTRTKPDPEPYLAALRHLDVPAEAAVVVENAPLGIRAAKAAGLRVVAIPTTNAPEALAEADVVVPSIRDVARALEGFA